MRIKLLCENLLIGDVNYGKGDVLEYEVDAYRKDQLLKEGKAEATNDPAGKVDRKAAIPVKVEDEATLFQPSEEGHINEHGPDSLKVTADTELTPEGRPIPAKAKK